MSDAGSGAPDRDEQGRTQTGRALVLVVVVALVAVLVLRHTGSSAAGSARSLRAVGASTSASTTTTTFVPPPAPTTTVPPSIPPADTTIEVLNGLEAGPLAGNLSGRLRLDGYKTLAPDNATTSTTTSVIYVVQAAYLPEARNLAATLGFPSGRIRIDRTVPVGAPIPSGAATGSDLIVVIGTSLQSLAAHPVITATSVPVSTSSATVPDGSTSTSTPPTSPSGPTTSSPTTSTPASTTSASTTSTPTTAP